MTVKALVATGLALALGAAACKPNPAVATGGTDSTHDTAAAAANEREQLMAEVSADARALSDIAAELSRVRVGGKLAIPAAETPAQARRDSIVGRVRLLTRQVASADAGLRESRQRIAGLTHVSDSLRATLDSTVANFQQMLTEQKTEIAGLNAQIDSLTGVTVALRDTLHHAIATANTAYYVIGTKDELEKRGIISEEGGSRFLFVLWKSGKTIVPARELDPTQFTQVDLRDATTIPLPDSLHSYRIVSRNDLSALATPTQPNGEIENANALSISAPQRFWATSKFLIIVQG